MGDKTLFVRPGHISAKGCGCTIMSLSFEVQDKYLEVNLLPCHVMWGIVLWGSRRLLCLLNILSESSKWKFQCW